MGLLLITAGTGCNKLHSVPDAVLYGTVDQRTWSETWPMQLSFAGDTIPGELKGSRVSSYLWLRYNLMAPQYVKIVVSRESLIEPEKTDTMTINLFTDDGKPIGKGTYGIYETHVALPHKIALTNGLTYRLWPATEQLGITDAGISFYLP